MKTLFAGLSLAALLAAAPAMAQSSTSPSTTTTTTQQSTVTTPGQTDTMNSYRASKLINTTVRNDANESVGNVNDILFDHNGKVTAVIVGVGGFLGMGERNVAMSFDQIHLTNNNGSLVAKANVTRDQLKSVPEWHDPNSSASTTTTTTSPSTTK